MTGSDFHIVLPEVILALYAMGALLFAVYTGKDALTGALTWATAGIFVAVALWIGVAGAGDNAAFGGLFVDDAYARFVKVVVLLSAAALWSWGQFARRAVGEPSQALAVQPAQTAMDR